ncbi:MAG: ABC transporter substrate-binding protein, partial [Candidatus Bathyarchaeota archaeon]
MRKTAAYIALVSLMLLVLFAPVSSENDLSMDVLRFQAILGLDGQLLAMQSGTADVCHNLIRTSDVETLDADGFLVTQDPGFHMGFVAYNIRADQSYRRSDPEALAYWPLKDVAFRHALVHCYDQEAIIGELYGYLVTPIQSLVPPAQARFVNPTAPTHPYNPGDPFASPAGEHSTCGILKEKGYTFVDLGTIGVVDEADYWKTPVGTALPYMKIWTPLLEVAPTSYRHVEEFAKDLAAVGLRATPANGYHGMINEGEDWNWYLAQVYDHANFDGYMVFYSLGRIPDQLYSLLHSSQGWPWWGRNTAGVFDQDL